MNIPQREILFASVVGLTATMAILGMSRLVAAPKLLFGRSLSAIPPSLFPYITLSLIVLLSIGLIVISSLAARRSKSFTKLPDNLRAAEVSPDRITSDDGQTDNPSLQPELVESDGGWLKICFFFFVLTAYGLLLKPIGFLLSSFLAISMTSLMLGNRHWLQILLLSILAPVCLYLIATRAMLVSLPELNQIELGYASLINWVTNRFAP